MSCAQSRRFRRASPIAQPSIAQVFVKDGDRCWLVQIEHITLIESEGNYTRVYFGEERPLILRSLAALEAKLDERPETAVDGGLVIGAQE
jgi:two-component system, LytTR family, response regulator